MAITRAWVAAWWRDLPTEAKVLLVVVLLLVVLGFLVSCDPRTREPGNTPVDTVVAVPGDTTITGDSLAASEPEEFGEDSTVPLADTLVGDTTGRRRAPAPSAGLRVGLSTYLPTKDWSSGFLGATTLAGTPGSICPLLRAAEAVGMSLGFTFPRPLMTENGQRIGRFSLVRGKALVDAIDRACPASDLARFTANRTLNYFTIMDDPGCLPCWGGRAVALAEIAELAAYAQEKIGEAPIGVRLAPEQMTGYSGWDGNLDMAVVQWGTHKRQPQAEWYKRQRDLMPRLGLAKLVYAVNTSDCDGPGSGPCSPDELLRYGTVAIDQPGSCGFFNWKYEEGLMRQLAYRDVWTKLVARGKTKTPARTCARTTTLGAIARWYPQKRRSPRTAPVVTILPTTLDLQSAAARGTLQGHARDNRGAVRTTWKWTVRNTNFVLPITSTRSAVTVVPNSDGATYVVGAGAGDSDSSLVTVSGVSPPPPAGIAIQPGDNWQTHVTANPIGTVFIPQAGIHRFAQITAPKNSIQIIGLNGAIATGARVLTSWTQSGANWYADSQTQEATYKSGWQCDSLHPLCYRPEMVWVDDSLYISAATLATIGPGKFFFDYDADRIYINVNPAGKTIETSVTPYLIAGSATGVVVKNLTVQRYANSNGYGAVGYQTSGANWTVDDVQAIDNHGVGIKGSTGWRILKSSMLRNGQMGYGCSGNNIVFEDDTIAWNNNNGNTAGQAGEAGGGKCTRTNGLTIRRSFSHHNHGPGFWTDIDNINTLYEYNKAEDNDWRGFFHEISYAAVIRYNESRRNGFNLPFATPAALDGAGILVSSSRNVEIYGNTVEDNKHGIGALETERPAGLYGATNVLNLYVHDNVVKQLDAGRAAGSTDTDTMPGVDPYSVAANNRWVNNTYHRTLGTTKWRWAPNADITEAAWRLLQDTLSTFGP